MIKAAIVHATTVVQAIGDAQFGLDDRGAAGDRFPPEKLIAPQLEGRYSFPTCQTGSKEYPYVGNIAKGHHFVTRGYLQGFTDTGDRNGKLWVFDFRVNRLFNPNPRGVALETNFNKIDLPGYAPD